MSRLANERLAAVPMASVPRDGLMDRDSYAKLAAGKALDWLWEFEPINSQILLDRVPHG